MGEVAGRSVARPRFPLHLGLTAPAAAAFSRLVVGLGDLAELGGSTPCQRDPEPYTALADGQGDQSAARLRSEAAEACRCCPVLDLCQSYAEAAGEGWHVWGGQDRTPSQRAG